MKKSAAVLALMVLALAGCASTPEKDVAYQSINDFAAAYEDAIGGDTECSRTSLDINDAGWIQTGCGHVILMMFTSDDMREEILQKNPLEAGERWVDGPNWSIVAAQYEAEDAQAALGGTLRD
ncbi:hypothetical protein [Arthrobacter luteolus]|uniref:hypothetical protein n=1 Tax=Arthrobacter luteolus TaxID=98672 RepID=UPI000ACFCEE0|nr:hypothetical protein [Arthrobacter luteolus]